MKRRILLVDDEPAILLALRAILEMNGFEVATAATSQEAVRKLKEGPDFHMVITDLKMESESSGYDVIRAAKELGSSPAVAVLTAFPALGESGQSRGADSILVKPMNTEDLLRQIEVLLIQHEDQKQKKAAGKAALAKARKRRAARRAS